MLFASFDFLLFIAPIFLGFWALRDRPMARTALLIAASYFFYMASARPADGSLPTPWYFAGLLVISTVLDYVASARIDARAAELDSSDPQVASRAASVRKRWLLLSLVGNLGLLGYFKYTNFFLEAFTDVASQFGASWVAPHLELFLPIGISFYTFQSLSYTIDVWRRRLSPEPSFPRFALFVVFFPQLVAGPIVRASEFLPQLHQRPGLREGDLEEGLFRIAKGLFKKVVLGDFIAVYFADLVFDAPQDYTSLENLLALYAFTLQIYADFSGYSDIAIGVARMLGFKIPENFDRPYQAKNLGEFWRKWHMTLSTWLRDYLFFPLGGSRGSKLRTYFNVWLTMFLVGMWHGASWNFVVYSNLHGAAMVFNRWNRLRSKDEGGPLRWFSIAAVASVCGLLLVGVGHAIGLDGAVAWRLLPWTVAFFLVVALLPDTGTRANAFLHIVLTFHFTVISRIFFRAKGLDNATAMLSKMLDWDLWRVRDGLFRWQSAQKWVDAHASELSALHAPLHGLTEYVLGIVLALGTAYHFTSRDWVEKHLRAAFLRLPGWAIGLVYAALCLLILKLLDGPRANIYFEF
jgi:D-alanyl-lipoteichoic acid acyltransferase DltB (MBOAT superfamily)